MEEKQHGFDWKEFAFFVLLCVAVVSVGAASRYGFELARSSFVAEPLASITHISLPPLPRIPRPVPERVINSLTIDDAIPAEGKFIAADLVAMKLFLYQDGNKVEEFPILTKGRPGTPWETPAGFYSVQTKERNHFSSIGKVYMPYSMQFYGNYFIHGWPYYPDGAEVSSSFSGGCIRLSTDDAAKVYAFADKGTSLFVYDAKETNTTPLKLARVSLPTLSAQAYLVADVDTGDVYAERNASTPLPIASITKLMTALVANEVISFEHKITVPKGELEHPEVLTNTLGEQVLIGNLLYPLLMESNNAVADTIAHYYGQNNFVRVMNTTARALGMQSTTFQDPSGVSSENVSTPDDLYRLAQYLANKKSFIWDITKTPKKTLTSEDGTKYVFGNFNKFADREDFVGGKVGHTTDAADTMLSIFKVPTQGETHRVAVVVLGSEDYTKDTEILVDWFNRSTASLNATACVDCAKDSFRKIEP